MKNTLKEAMKANDLPKIRELLVEIIRNESGTTTRIEEVTEALETTPGLFDLDDGKNYPRSAERMNEELIDRLADDLKSNFSLEKFRLLTEVYAKKAEDPDFYTPNPSAEVKPADEKKGSPQECKACKKKCNCASVVGAVIMALGCAAAIVGLCVPVKFLLGLGIGVFMLGTAFVYMSITGKR